jgi:hypothetical protein
MIMAHTGVEYDNRLVDVNEIVLRCLISMMWHEATLHTKNNLQAEVYKQRYLEWMERVNTSGNGCLDLPLDELLGNDKTKKQEFLYLLSLAEHKIHSFGDKVPGEYIDPVADLPKELTGSFLLSQSLLGVLQDLRDLILKRTGGKWIEYHRSLAQKPVAPENKDSK